MSDSKRKQAIDYLMKRLEIIERDYKTLSQKSSQWTKAVNAVNTILLKKERSEVTGKLVEGRAPTTYHKDLTALRNAVRGANYKHPSLTSKRRGKGHIVNAVADYPQYADDLRAIAKMPAATINKGKADLKEKMHKELEGEELDKAIDCIDALLVDHPVVSKLRKSKARREIRMKNEQESLDLKNKNENLKKYNFPALIKTAEKLLNSSSYTKLSWAIALVTGRRSVEILYHAKFEKVDSKTLLFSGQSKKRAGTVTEAYKIPVLVNADKVVKALDRLRSMPSVSVFRTNEKYTSLGKIELNEAINQRTNGVLNAMAKRITSDNAEVFKNTRNIYARYCSNEIRPNSEDYPRNEDEFLKAILGHESTREVKHYRQVELEFKENESWLKVEEKEKEKETKKKTKAKTNYRAGSEIKAIGKLVDNYTGETDDKGHVFVSVPERNGNVRKVKLKTIQKWHKERLRVWAYENAKMPILQTTVIKNKGNTLKSGTGSANIYTNRYTYQAWAKIAGDLLTQYNDRKLG